jgi:hypothetical protein
MQIYKLIQLMIEHLNDQVHFDEILLEEKVHQIMVEFVHLHLNYNQDLFQVILIYDQFLVNDIY